jgi:hypothetical protein
MRWWIPFSVLVLIGCGASTGVQRAEPITETTTTTSATTRTSTVRLDDGEGSFSFHPSQWALESIEPGAQALWVRDAAGGCDQFDHAEVTESAKAVTITVINRFPTGGLVCTADLRAARVRVELPSALGGRKILGECPPGDDTPQQRICDAMHQAAAASPERP